MIHNAVPCARCRTVHLAPRARTLQHGAPLTFPPAPPSARAADATGVWRCGCWATEVERRVKSLRGRFRYRRRAVACAARVTEDAGRRQSCNCWCALADRTPQPDTYPHKGSPAMGALSFACICHSLSRGATSDTSISGCSSQDVQIRSVTIQNLSERFSGCRDERHD